MDQSTLKTVSKFLSYVLRHHPEAIGITLDREGWVDIGTLLAQAAAHGRRVNKSLLHEVVATSDKKRFTLSSDGLRIRAAQGHSTPQVAIGYMPQIPPETLYHGTAERFLESIREQGLIAGQRHHVHLSATKETAVQVGRRHGKAVVLAVDSGKMQRGGFEFYLSDNQVWLTDHVPPEYLREDRS